MKWTTNKVRNAFLKFFSEKDHHILASASLVPNDDPSLLWINSGVATLKPYFEGKIQPPAARMVNSQKAIRTNDIENVGITSRHHTFFEMLGNFSIGDYQKTEAILWAWEFLTSEKWLNLPSDKLYITIFSEDEAAWKIWTEQVKVPPERIIKGTRTTNFWDMGQGPCGPNTEIYYDRGLQYDPTQTGLKLLIDDCENDRYIEIWNIVFSEFNNDGFNHYTELPRKNIDTGAGLERIVSILQDVPTNFDIDLFQAIIQKIETLTDKSYQINNYFKPNPIQTKINTAFKIISDHIRCLTFAIADGVYPSNKSRGYILRRLLRRAEMYGHQIGIDQAFLYMLVPTVVQQMQDHYRELEAHQHLIITIIKNEELKFRQTLKTGHDMLMKLIKTNQKLSAKAVFMLFDTYGYPFELTQEIAKQAKLQVDVTGFKMLLEQHKTLAQKARTHVQALKQQNPFLTKLNLTSKFVGYETEKVANAQIKLLFENQSPCEKLENQTGYLILDQTPFYAEKGGQAADDGVIIAANGLAQVIDVQSGPNNLIIHQVEVNGQLSQNDIVKAEINHWKRFYTQKNHTGTHLLHAALREVLGNHVMQSGSFNNQDYLRLDFSHFQTITANEQLAIEHLVEQWIQQAEPCQIHFLTYQAAVAMGALAFFGEKYDSIVRVVQFADFSIELCGGTHCANTKAVEDLLITNIENKGSGSYRITALTSHQTIQRYLETKIAAILQTRNDIMKKYQAIKDTHPNQALETLAAQLQHVPISKTGWRTAKLVVEQLHESLKQHQKSITKQNNQQLIKAYLAIQPIKMNNGQTSIIFETMNLPSSSLKMLSDYYLNQSKNQQVIILNQIPENGTFILIHHQQLINEEKLTAADQLLQNIFQTYKGKGGGTTWLAQGKSPSMIKTADIIKLINAQKFNK